MSNLTANQIFKSTGLCENGKKFADWLDDEKKLYQSKIDQSKITDKMSFIDWLNRRWQGKMNYMKAVGSVPILDLSSAQKAQKEKGTVIGNILKDATKQVLDKAAGKSSGTISDKSSFEQGPIVTEKRILGMKPGVVYVVGGVLALGATIGIIYAIKKRKQSA